MRFARSITGGPAGRIKPINIAVPVSFILTTLLRVRCVNVGVKLPVLWSSPVISILRIMSRRPSPAGVDMPSTINPVFSYVICGTPTEVP